MHKHTVSVLCLKDDTVKDHQAILIQHHT